MNPPLTDTLQARARALKLYGLLAYWDQIPDLGWVETLIGWEEAERARRGLERRRRTARLGRFKPLADFDWHWPTRCDRAAIEALMGLAFLTEPANVVLIGPNGVGKSTVAQNVAHQALLAGHTVLFTSAGQMLSDLAAQESDRALRQRLAFYSRPRLLCVDEIGYLDYSNRQADLLFEIVSRRYEDKSTLVTTNRPFGEWPELFPNAACVASLVDRLVHHAEIIHLDGESYRLKEAKARAERHHRRNTPSPGSTTGHA